MTPPQVALKCRPAIDERVSFSGARAKRTPTITLKSNDSLSNWIGSPTWLSPNVSVFREGDPAKYLYKIKSGYIRTFRIMNDGSRYIDAFYSSGEIFGLEPTNAYRVSAETITRCGLHAAKINTLAAVATNNVATISFLLTATALELRRSQNHSLLLRKIAQERVVGFLLDMAKRKTAQHEVDLPMSRFDIADYLGLTTETVSRMLWKLERGSVISIRPRSVVLLDLPALNKINRLK